MGIKNDKRGKVAPFLWITQAFLGKFFSYVAKVWDLLSIFAATKDSYMKKEIGKWLLDIAKYITTAVVLSSIFNGIEQQWMVVASGIGAVILTFTGGALLLREKKK